MRASLLSLARPSSRGHNHAARGQRNPEFMDNRELLLEEQEQVAQGLVQRSVHVS